MPLVLEIEYLSGVAYAARGPDSQLADWPPQPDRIFSALVATWAARGGKAEETEVLEWMESLPAPRILASAAGERTSVVAFVPPNDPKNSERGVLPSLRRRQPRRFPAVRPYDALVQVIWPDAEPATSQIEVLQQLARDMSYVGHSSSLTRCRFLIERDGESHGQDPMRWVYPGRLDELRAACASGRRPQQGAVVRAAPAPGPDDEASVFGDRWLVLEHVGGRMPDIRGSVVVARVIRDALLSGYQRTGARNAIPDIISGHSPGGAAAQSVHIAIVPLAFVAHRHADCNVLGFALVPPRGAPVFEDPDFRRALAAIAPADSKRARRIIVVRPRSGTAADETFSLELAPTFEASKRSLDASDYVGPAHVFGTVTPLLLDRHLRKNVDRDLQLAEQIAAACRNIGLPDPVRVLAHRHAAFPGVPSVPAHSSGRPWLRWRIPDSAGGRQLTHAVIEFDRPVRGPVLLGAGRYAGLGLCRPLQEEVE